METHERFGSRAQSDVPTLSSFAYSEDDIITATSSICSEFYKQNTDPKSVLTNPVVVKHLRKLHYKAKMRQSPVLEDEEESEEYKQQLSDRVDVYNNRVYHAYMRVTLQEDQSYFGPLKFYLNGHQSDDCDFHLLNLKDTDSVEDIMPILKERFKISDEEKCSIRQVIQGDEILLDSSERPLPLAVNSSGPVSFHLHKSADKNTALLKTLEDQHLTPRLHKKLMEKFNFDDGDRSSSSGYKAASLSSNASDTRYDSLTDSINNKSTTSPNGKTKSKKVDRKESQNFTMGMKPKLKKTKKIHSENKPKKTQSITNIDRRGRESKKSSAARKIFSSIRKSARGRSGSRERKNSNSSISYHSDNENELSSDLTLPGILKIFGDAVSPGSNYKSVLATQQSNAQELVKAALERYGVSRNHAKKFVLCEVVGRLKNDDKPKSDLVNGLSSHDKIDFSRINNFVEDYVRPLNDHEKPLILQSYWKPLDGYARRFEIRRKSKIEEVMEKDTETHDVNAQAKRLIIQKSRLPNSSSTNDVSSCRYSSSSESEDEENKVYERKCEPELEKDETNKNVAAVDHAPSPEQFANNDKEENSTWPYLMTLQGETGVKGKPGNVVHKLTEIPLVIGGEETSKSHSVDILLNEAFTTKSHCVVHCEKRKNPDRLLDVSKYYSEWKIKLHVIGDSCAVNVNGEAVNNSTEVTGGCLISIEDHFIFMLKDPTCDKKLSNSVRFSFGVANGHRNSAFTPVVTRKKRIIRTEVCFEAMYCDQVLDAIFVAAQDIVTAKNELYCESSNTEKELSPAKLICLSIEHACLNFHEEEKREFLLKIASKLQNVVLEATAAVSELQNNDKIKDPDEGISYLLPFLKPVVFWMSNSLEIFSFLQTDLEDLIKARVVTEKDGTDDEIKELLAAALSFQVSEDILAVLEEVVMYSFQQLVYYLTKTLYGALPSLLDSNPFADSKDDDSLLSRDGGSRILLIYEAAKGLTRTFGVHKDIENQLFAYLFFFTSVSLFNTLMSEESASVYYRWEKGVQIRGNLEEIEMWASDHGFQEQSAMFLQKFSTLASLLATPRSQMLKSTWSNFRRDFKQLHPSQLRQILDRYFLPTSKPRPASWMPDAGDLEESTEEQFVMESYDNHPPLVLPTDGIQLDMKLIPEEDWFVSLQEFIVAVGTGRSLNTISNSDSAYQSMNRYGGVEGKKRQDKEYHRSTSDESSQASLTESEINNNTIIREKVNYPSYDDNEDSLLSSTSVSSITSTRSKPTNSNTNSTTISTPVPTPRKNTTPVPSPRQYNTASSRSSDSDVKHRTISNQSDDITIQGFHSPERNVAQILLNSDSVSEKSKPRTKSKKRSSRKKSNASPEKENMKVLPLQSTEVKHSETKSNEQFTDTDSSISQSLDEYEAESTQLTPNEVFIVDVVKGKDGLGLGLVDGMFTSLKVNGVFVRSLVPDGPAIKHSHMKHQEVIRCWLQDGRLNLGDRILAVNGKSLLTTNYRTAMRIVRQSGDRMRFLVGRCGPEVAMKITSSSC